MDLNSAEWALFVAIAAAGLLIGSFLNVLIHRGPSMWGLIDVATPRGDLIAPGSYCPSCGTPIAPWRLVPLFSYVVQKGRCAACGAKIPFRYPLVELLGALIALSAATSFGVGWTMLAAALFGWALIALAFIDLETGYLPDAMTLSLVGIGIVVNAFDLFTPLPHAAIGALAGYLSFRAIAFIFEKLRGREGLGQGDAKLLAAVGAWGGWTILPAVVFIGAVATLSVVALRRIGGATIDNNAEIPFGPGLCLGGFIWLLLSQSLLSGL